MPKSCTDETAMAVIDYQELLVLKYLVAPLDYTCTLHMNFIHSITCVAHADDLSLLKEVVFSVM
jgi:hypothetical protein